MATKTYENQKLLCLITPPDSNLIGEIGEEAEASGPEAFSLSNSRGSEGFFLVPTEAGFHVWEGEIECFGGDSGPGGNDPQDADVAWHGDWRPATLEDLKVFGVTIPRQATVRPCEQEACPCLDPDVLPTATINACSPIHQFFGLSYANYLVLPRSMLQSMPKSWQAKFVGSLHEIRQRLGDYGGDYQVLMRNDRGQFVTDPLSDYERGRRVIPSKP